VPYDLFFEAIHFHQLSTVTNLVCLYIPVVPHLRRRRVRIHVRRAVVRVERTVRTGSYPGDVVSPSTWRRSLVAPPRSVQQCRSVGTTASPATTCCRHQHSASLNNNAISSSQNKIFAGGNCNKNETTWDQFHKAR